MKQKANVRLISSVDMEKVLRMLKDSVRESSWTDNHGCFAIQTIWTGLPCQLGTSKASATARRIFGGNNLTPPNFKSYWQACIAAERIAWRVMIHWASTHCQIQLVLSLYASLLWQFCLFWKQLCMLHCRHEVTQLGHVIRNDGRCSVRLGQNLTMPMTFCRMPSILCNRAFSSWLSRFCAVAGLLSSSGCSAWWSAALLSKAQENLNIWLAGRQDLRTIHLNHTVIHLQEGIYILLYPLKGSPYTVLATLLHKLRTSGVLHEVSGANSEELW